MIINEIKNFSSLQFYLQKLKLFEIIKNQNFFIAGGVFTSFFSDKKINDIDLFFHTKENMEEAVEQIKMSVDTIYNENDMVFNFFINDVKIQIIKKYFFKTPEEIFENFDFTIVKFCCNSLFTYHHERFFEDLMLKRLVMDNKILIKPLSTLARSYKYVNRGYTICPVGIRRIIENIQDKGRIDFANSDSNEIEFYPGGNLKFNGLD